MQPKKKGLLTRKLRWQVSLKTRGLDWGQQVDLWTPAGHWRSERLRTSPVDSRYGHKDRSTPRRRLRPPASGDHTTSVCVCVYIQNTVCVLICSSLWFHQSVGTDVPQLTPPPVTQSGSPPFRHLRETNGGELRRIPYILHTWLLRSETTANGHWTHTTRSASHLQGFAPEHGQKSLSLLELNWYKCHW